MSRLRGRFPFCLFVFRHFQSFRLSVVHTPCILSNNAKSYLACPAGQWVFTVRKRCGNFSTETFICCLVLPGARALHLNGRTRAQETGREDALVYPLLPFVLVVHRLSHVWPSTRCSVSQTAIRLALCLQRRMLQTIENSQLVSAKDIASFSTV